MTRKPSLVPGVEVLLQVVDDDAGRVVVLGKDAEVDRVVVVEDAHLGVEGGRLAFARIVLDEVCAPPARSCQAGSSSTPSSVSARGADARSAAVRRALSRSRSDRPGHPRMRDGLPRQRRQTSRSQRVVSSGGHSVAEGGRGRRGGRGGATSVSMPAEQPSSSESGLALKPDLRLRKECRL